MQTLIEKVLEGAKRPPKRLLDAAVKATRLYHGSSGRVRMRDAQRLYTQMLRAINKVEAWMEKQDLYSGDTFDQIVARATQLGPIFPSQGKDI